MTKGYKPMRFLRNIAMLVISLLFLVSAASPAFAAEGTVELLAIANSYQLENASGQVDSAVSTEFLAGRTLYFEVFSQQGVAAADVYTEAPTGYEITDSDKLRSFTTGLAVRQGADLLDGRPHFVFRDNASGEKRLYLALSLSDSYKNPKDSTLDVTIAVTAKNGCALRPDAGGSYSPNNRWELPLLLDVCYGVTEVSAPGAHLVASDAPILQVSGNAGTAILCFESGVELEGNFAADDGMFVRVSTYNEELADRFPAANAYCFETDRNKLGAVVTVRIPAASMEGADGKPRAPYLYSVGDGMSAINASYSVEEELFTFETRRLGHYLVSCEPLDSIMQSGLENSETALGNDEESAPAGTADSQPEKGRESVSSTKPSIWWLLPDHLVGNQ